MAKSRRRGSGNSRRRLGFEVLEERQLLAVDFGDAPDLGLGTRAGDYRTLANDHGARHTIVTGLHLGASVDGIDGGVLQNDAANADDVNGALPDDEDGVANPQVDFVLTVGTTPRVNLWATNTTGTEATLYGWIDYDGDGEFENATETASIAVPSAAAASIVTLAFPTVPDGFQGETYARFRLSTDPAAAESTGPAADGEVEDYQVHITVPTQGVFNTGKTILLGEGRNGVPDFPGQRYFGRALASLGDLDGDGVTDLVAGTEVGRGQLQVLLMNRNGTVKSAQSIIGYRDEFGIAVASLGDVDVDGVTDIAVGDDEYVVVVFLNRDGSEKSRQFVTDVYGVSLAGLGDFDGDGTPDLAIGVYDWGDIDERGEVRIVLLNSDGTLKSQQIIGNEIGGGPTLLPEDEFGGAITSIGDLDGDGISDIAVGATGDGITLGQTRDDTDRGAVHILLLNTNGTVKSSRKITTGSGDGPVLGEYGRFGSALAFMGDLDGDGYPDLMVGAYDYEVDGLQLGEAYLLNLNSDGTVKRNQLIPFELVGIPNLDERIKFGTAIASLGDLDGDGVADVAVSAPRLDLEHGDDGAVFLLHLQPETRYGDYNNDDVVDAADYSVWRDTLGAIGLTPYFGADGDGDGMVDQDDYLVWKANFGRVVESGGAVDIGTGPQAADEIGIAGQVALNPPSRASSGTQKQGGGSGEQSVSSGTRAVRSWRGLELLGRDERGGRTQVRPPAELGAGGLVHVAAHHRDLALLAWRRALVARWRGRDEELAIGVTTGCGSQDVGEADGVFEELGSGALRLCTR